MSTLQVGTPVIVFGLTSNERLNNCAGEVKVDFDGDRYGIVMKNGENIRVTPKNLAPLRARDFAMLQRRISYELCCFATEFNDDDDTTLFTVDRKHVAPMVTALRATLTHVKVHTHSNMLQLYANGNDEPYAQLMPASSPIEQALRLEVVARNKKVSVEPPSADDAIRDGIMLMVDGNAYFYANCTPRYHLPISTMRVLVSENFSPLVLANIIDTGKFLMTTPHSIFYAPDERLLLFEVGLSDPVRLVSLQWPAMAFKVARLTHATKHRLRLTRTIVDEPTRRLDARRVFPPHMSALLEGKLDEVVDVWSQGGGDGHADACVQLSNAGMVSMQTLAVDPVSFLHTQVLLCSHFLEWVQRRRDAGEVAADVVELNAILGEVYHLLARSPKKSADVAMKMMAGCVPGVHVDFLLPASIMIAVNVEPRLLRAWMANAESMLCAVELVHGDGSLDIDMNMDGDGNILAIRQQGRTLRVGNFAAHPIEMQRRIFLCDATARVVDMCTDNILEALTEKSASFLGKPQASSSSAPRQSHASVANAANKLLQEIFVVDASTSAKESTASCEADPSSSHKLTRKKKQASTPPASLEAIATAQRMQDELLADEERDKAKAAANKAKKERKKANRKNAKAPTVVADVSPPAEEESPAVVSSCDDAEPDDNKDDANDGAPAPVFVVEVSSSPKSPVEVLPCEDDAKSDDIRSETASADSATADREFIMVETTRTQKMRNQLKRVEGECADVRDDYVKMTHQLRMMQSQGDRTRARVEKQLGEKDALIRALENQVATDRKEKQAADKTVKAHARTMEEQITKLRARVADLEGEVRVARDEAEKKRAADASALSELQEKHGALQVHESAHEAKIALVEKELEKANKETQRLKDRLMAKSTELDRLKESSQAVEKAHCHETVVLARAHGPHEAMDRRQDSRPTHVVRDERASPHGGGRPPLG